MENTREKPHPFNNVILVVSFSLLITLTLIYKDAFSWGPPEFKEEYLLTSPRHFPPSLLAASVPKEGKIVETVALTPGCTLSPGARIQLVEKLSGVLYDKGVYRIYEPHNNLCPDKRFYVTMLFKDADNLIKSGQALLYNPSVSNQESLAIIKAELPPKNAQ